MHTPVPLFRTACWADPSVCTCVHVSKFIVGHECPLPLNSTEACDQHLWWEAFIVHRIADTWKLIKQSSTVNCFDKGGFNWRSRRIQLWQTDALDSVTPAFGAISAQELIANLTRNNERRLWWPKPEAGSGRCSNCELFFNLGGTGLSWSLWSMATNVAAKTLEDREQTITNYVNYGLAMCEHYTLAIYL